MYRFYEDFTTHTDDFAAYNIEVEKTSNLEHKHGRVENGGYSLNCSGNKHLLITPALNDFELSCKVKFTTTSFSIAAQDRNVFRNAGMFIVFDYNTISRCGKKIEVQYNLEGRLTISLIALNGIKHEVLNSKVYYNVDLCVDKTYEFKADANSNNISGSFDGYTFDFDLSEREKGRVGIGRCEFAGCLLYNDVLLTADDIKEETVVAKKEVTLPRTYGGLYPYKLLFEIVKKDDINLFRCRLSGGASSCPKDRPANKGQYGVMHDDLDDVYIRLMKGKSSVTLYLKNGNLHTVDPHVHWQYICDYFGITEFPVKKEFAISDLFASKDIKIAIGTSHWNSGGYHMQARKNVEMIYDTDGNLLYNGGKLTENSYEFLSPADKQVVSKVPADLPEYDNVVEHLKNNHYFMPGERIKITLRIRTATPFDEISVKPHLLDVYSSMIEQHISVQPSVVETNFLGTDLNVYDYSVALIPLEPKLYKLAFEVFEGDSVIKETDVTFEVVSSDVPAPILSGLPFMYSTPNEMNFLDRDAFDMYSPEVSGNFEHYFACSAFTPQIGIDKQIYRINKELGRKWFMWLTDRTQADWANYEKYIDGIKNCDYMSYFYIKSHRDDMFRIQVYNLPHIKEELVEFFEKYPEYGKEFTFTLDDEFTNADLAKLLNMCGHTWLKFHDAKNMQRIADQNEIFEKINPDIKRASYGPFPPYATPHGSYNMLKYVGLDVDKDLSEFYKGWYQFEDYPSSCAYYAFRGAFAMMSMKLHNPKLKYYPEMYIDRKRCCADGLVAYARPPFGSDFNFPPYYHATQAFEYVYSTAYKKADGTYDYWRDYGFMMRDTYNEYIEDFVKRWKHVNIYNPAKPLKTLAFVTDYNPDDDHYELQYQDRYNWNLFYNKSECTQSFINSVARKAGYGAGFALKNDTIKTLTPDETNVLILASLKNVDNETLSHIRKLYDNGVSLIATSDVDGLEDIFGVKKCPKTVHTDTLYYSGSEENIYPLDVEYTYEANGAEVVVSANEGAPAILKNGRAVLINAPASMLGVDWYYEQVQFGRENISALLHEAMEAVLNDITDTPVKANGCGLSAVTTKEGKTVLVLFNYTPYHMEHLPSEVTVDISIPGVKDIVCDDASFIKFTKDGCIYKLKATLPPRSTAVIELI